jgi:tRNA U54 and U55 pseudouridine synthase Pus10
MAAIRQGKAGVQVRGLQLTGYEEFATLKVGEESKRKHYRALCWAARPLQHTDVQVGLATPLR